MPELTCEAALKDHTKENWYIRLLTSLYLATFLIRLSFGIITITFPDYTGIQENASFGFLWAAGPLAEFITVMFIGNLIDKYGRRWALLLGLLGGALSNAFIALSTNYYVLYSVMILHGFSGACILVSSLALLADYVPSSHRGREIGMFDGINLAGWGAGFFVGGFLKDFLGDRLVYSFVVGGILAICGFAYAYFNLKEPCSRGHLVKELRASHILSVMKNRSILLLVLPWFVLYMLIGDIFAFFPKASSQDFGIGGWIIGLAMALGCTAIVLFQRGYGQLADKWGRNRVMVVGVAGIIGLLLSVGAIYSSVPNLNQEPIEKTIRFDDPSDFLNGNFTQGNGTVQGGTIRTLDSGEVIFTFGPLDPPQDMRVDTVKARWEGQFSNISLNWSLGKDFLNWSMQKNKVKTLEPRPYNVTFTVIMKPTVGQNGTLQALEVKVRYVPNLDIIQELFDRPWIIGGIAMSAAMAGAFAPSALASLADESKKKSRGMTMAIYIVMLSLGQVVGPPVTGYLLDTYGSFGFLFFMIACGIFLAIIMVLRWFDKKAQERAARSAQKKAGPSSDDE